MNPKNVAPELSPQMRKQISEATIKAIKPALKGKRYTIMDKLAPGFGIRVTDTGHATYGLTTRPPGFKHPVFRAIAQVGAITLPAARQTARDWKTEMLGGVDPKIREVTAAVAAVNAAASAFETVAESYITNKLGTKKKDEIAAAIRREFVTPWKGKALPDITQANVADVVTEKEKTHPAQARALLKYIAGLFEWAEGTGKIKRSPAANVDPAKVFKHKIKSRSRVLTDAELVKVWLATYGLGYPLGPMYRLLILTGLRKNEVAKAVRGEINRREKTWVIPAERMKGKLAHLVPLTPAILKELDALPKLNEGDFLFSNTNGVKPVWMDARAKGTLDKAARVFGWVNHDLRRTMRSHLSKLPIEEHVRELMIAHKRKGIAGVYDLEEYKDEKRAGFELWCARLESIVNKERITA